MPSTFARWAAGEQKITWMSTAGLTHRIDYAALLSPALMPGVEEAKVLDELDASLCKDVHAAAQVTMKVTTGEKAP